METIDRLHEILARCDGMVTRQWVNDQRDSLKGRGQTVKRPYLIVDNENVRNARAAEPHLGGDTPISILRLSPSRTAGTKPGTDCISNGGPARLRLGPPSARDQQSYLPVKVMVPAVLSQEREDEIKRKIIEALDVEPDVEVRFSGRRTVKASR